MKTIGEMTCTYLMKEGTRFYSKWPPTNKTWPSTIIKKVCMQVFREADLVLRQVTLNTIMLGSECSRQIGKGLTKSPKL